MVTFVTTMRVVRVAWLWQPFSCGRWSVLDLPNKLWNNRRLDEMTHQETSDGWLLMVDLPSSYETTKKNDGWLLMHQKIDSSLWWLWSRLKPSDVLIFAGSCACLALQLFSCSPLWTCNRRSRGPESTNKTCADNYCQSWQSMSTCYQTVRTLLNRH